jgi:hypothetical protein
MKHRIIKHQWMGAYINDSMHYYTIEKRQINIISIFKRLIFINKDWADCTPIKDKREPIHFQELMDAENCFLRLISGESIGNWKETIIL